MSLVRKNIAVFDCLFRNDDLASERPNGVWEVCVFDVRLIKFQRRG